MEREPYFSIVHKVRPGITSLGMVKYGYANSVDKMIDRLKYDIIYMENISLLLDLKILIYTVKTVVSGRGI
jgi:lipopolysaccharide/colanic/teichoic acid biosynthesis glycosyltransferase